MSSKDPFVKICDGLNYESKGGDNIMRSWGMLPGLQHFKSREVCWSSETRRIDKQVNYLHGPTQTKQQGLHATKTTQQSNPAKIGQKTCDF
jgi:hypothetical protein